MKVTATVEIEVGTEVREEAKELVKRWFELEKANEPTSLNGVSLKFALLHNELEVKDGWERIRDKNWAAWRKGSLEIRRDWITIEESPWTEDIFEIISNGKYQGTASTLEDAKNQAERI